jgi:hypothetical protein
MKTAFNLANKERLYSISLSAAGFARKVTPNKENKPAPQVSNYVPDGPYGLAKNPMGFYFTVGLTVSCSCAKTTAAIIVVLVPWATKKRPQLATC